MAQSGCFVPAEFGSFPICDQIFTRIEHNDDLRNEYSAFMVEMKDMSYILQNVTSESLVIIDELGRSTSMEEGLGLCHSICEELIQKKAFVFFATHFLEIMDMDALYPNVENHHFDPQNILTSERRQLRLDHTLKKGPYRGPLYGFDIAEHALLPEKLLTEAKVLAESLRNSRQDSRNAEENVEERAVFRLAYKLIHAGKHMSREGNVGLYLNRLKRKFLEDVGMSESETFSV